MLSSPPNTIAFLKEQTKKLSDKLEVSNSTLIRVVTSLVHGIHPRFSFLNLVTSQHFK